MSKKIFNSSEIKVLIDKLYPICRSIMGPGYRESLNIIKKLIPLQDDIFKTGMNVYDWTIPDEWSIEEGYILRPDGKKIADFKKHNLHIMNYSSPVNKFLTYKELKNHIYTIPKLPNAIPYTHSYYDRKWGFGLKYNEFKKLPKKGKYKAYINSKHYRGKLITSHLKLKGKKKKEIMLTSYLCHPQMANHELSGPIMMTLLYRYIKSLPKRNYTYRFMICPENIGSISYLSRYGEDLKKNLDGGLILNCLAHGKDFTYKKTRETDSLINKVIYNVLKHSNFKFIELDFFPDGSDERQFSSPGFNLQFGLLMRAGFARFKEYHTSLDDKNFFNMKTFKETYKIYTKVIDTLEMNFTPLARVLNGTPQLSKIKADIYPSSMAFNVSPKNENNRILLELLNLSDGKISLIDIANKKNFSLIENKPLIDNMIRLKLIKPII